MWLLDLLNLVRWSQQMIKFTYNFFVDWILNRINTWNISSIGMSAFTVSELDSHKQVKYVSGDVADISYTLDLYMRWNKSKTPWTLCEEWMMNENIVHLCLRANEYVVNVWLYRVPSKWFTIFTVRTHRYNYYYALTQTVAVSILYNCKTQFIVLSSSWTSDILSIYLFIHLFASTVVHCFDPICTCDHVVFKCSQTIFIRTCAFYLNSNCHNSSGKSLHQTP